MSRPSLTSAFESIPGAPLRGSLFRAIPLEYINTPLSAAGAFTRGGRYNPATAFEAFYIAYSPDTTLYELRVLAPKTAPTRTKPLITFTIDVALQTTIDLTDAANLSTLALAPNDLLIEWKAILIAGDVPITHDIGHAARDADVEAIIVPSARKPGATNLVIFPDRLRPGSSIQINPPTGFPVSTHTAIIGRYIPAPEIRKHREADGITFRGELTQGVSVNRPGFCSR